jgi:hypothetical protein
MVDEATRNQPPISGILMNSVKGFTDHYCFRRSTTNADSVNAFLFSSSATEEGKSFTIKGGSFIDSAQAKVTAKKRKAKNNE